MNVHEFNDLVGKFLAAEKVAQVRPRWRTAGHPEYAAAKMTVSAPNSRIPVGVVRLTAHRIRQPPKYGFALTFRGQRVLGLDVNPGRAHKNLLVKGYVGGTHWQRWPHMEAETDAREQAYAAWLRDFLRAGNVVTTFGVLSPPRGMQLELFHGRKGTNTRRY
jgi:hypothetical protein